MRRAYSRNSVFLQTLFLLLDLIWSHITMPTVIAIFFHSYGRAVPIRFNVIWRVKNVNEHEFKGWRCCFYAPCTNCAADFPSNIPLNELSVTSVVDCPARICHYWLEMCSKTINWAGIPACPVFQRTLNDVPKKKNLFLPSISCFSNSCAFSKVQLRQCFNVNRLAKQLRFLIMCI